MKQSLRLSLFFITIVLAAPATACSLILPGPEHAVSAQAVAIGKVVSEKIVESMPDEEYARSRSVTVLVTHQLKGLMPATVRSGISCGLGYAPVHSRVVVYMEAPGVFGVVEADGDYERAVRAKLRAAP
jgi:hypothetical protein